MTDFFRVEATDAHSSARAGRIFLNGQEILTPHFMPVATQGSVRAQDLRRVREAGAGILLANTFHLLQRPGLTTLKKCGGIKRLMNWPGLVLTDSGGYQVFSLANRKKISEEGVEFHSPWDGAHIKLTPESALEAQFNIGSDIWMMLDVCVASTAPLAEIDQAVEQTARWAARAIEKKQEYPAHRLYGIVQGGLSEVLRQKSLEQITAHPFDGFALGGLAVGESRAERKKILSLFGAKLPAHAPRYVMGIGTPNDLLDAILGGVDQFDCILPTAFAQQGVSFTWKGKLNLRRGVYAESLAPLDSQCLCNTCQTYSRAYLHHLIRSKEISGWSLVGEHNLYFYFEMLARAREAIIAGVFNEFYATHYEIFLQESEAIVPPVPRSSNFEAPLEGSLKSKARMELGDFRVTEKKEWNYIEHIPSGEKIHIGGDPFIEAKLLYANQVIFREDAPTVVWDVGFGAGTNAAAILERAEREGARLELISFEKDLNSFRLARINRKQFAHFSHPALFEIDQTLRWRSVDGQISWKLVLGDFKQTMFNEVRPDFIFFDPYSTKTNSDLWTADFFRELHGLIGDEPCVGFTYSRATPVRETLRAGGFAVEAGPAIPGKEETTRFYNGVRSH